MICKECGLDTSKPFMRKSQFYDNLCSDCGFLKKLNYINNVNSLVASITFVSMTLIPVIYIL
jgi:hypothetical protein